MSGRRDYPRLGVALHARLLLPGGGIDEGVTQNLSRAGFQLAVGPATVGCLFPHTHQPGPRERERAVVRLGTSADESDTVELSCAGVFARRMAQSEWHAGFEFVDLDESQQRWIDDRLASALPQVEGG
jgi:hypothetical protein